MGNSSVRYARCSPCSIVEAAVFSVGAGMVLLGGVECCLRFLGKAVRLACAQFVLRSICEKDLPRQGHHNPAQLPSGLSLSLSIVEPIQEVM